MLAVADDRRHQRAPFGVRQHDRQAIADGGDERIGRAEVDADRAFALMRRRRLARFRNLEERHQDSTAASIASMSLGQLGQERQFADLHARLRVCMFDVQPLRQLRLELCAFRAGIGEQRRQGAHVAVRLRIGGLLAPLELAREERKRQHRIRLADRIDIVQAQQVLRALTGFFSARYASFTRADDCNAARFCASLPPAKRSGCTSDCSWR